MSKKKQRFQIISKTNALKNLHLSCTYFERNMQHHPLFIPEFEVSQTINSILEAKEGLTHSAIVEVLNLLNDIDNVEHHDGSGWYDYQIRLAHFLWLHGFKTELKQGKLRVTGSILEPRPSPVKTPLGFKFCSGPLWFFRKFNRW